jgi:hypothetical protein
VSCSRQTPFGELLNFMVENAGMAGLGFIAAELSPFHRSSGRCRGNVAAMRVCCSLAAMQRKSKAKARPSKATPRQKSISGFHAGELKRRGSPERTTTNCLKSYGADMQGLATESFRRLGGTPTIG